MNRIRLLSVEDWMRIQGIDGQTSIPLSAAPTISNSSLLAEVVGYMEDNGCQLEQV